MEKIILKYLMLFITCMLLFPTAVMAKNIKVKKIIMHGNHTFDQDDLKDLIYSQEKKEFDARLIKVDKILLTNFYRENGFLIVEITDSLVRIDDFKVDIYYLINEGQRYFYLRSDIYGAEDIQKAHVNHILLKINKGSPFNEAVLNQNREEIENLYYNSGKPFIKVQLDYRFEQDSMVVVVVNIIENETVTIREIRYHGLQHVQQFIVRRELEFKKGDVYRRREFTKSQENIYSTGLFDYVRFEIKSTSEDSTGVDIHINLREKDARWVGLRGGFAYDEVNAHGNKIELIAEGGHRNLYGTARSISLHAVPSFSFDLHTKELRNIENQLALIFVEPWIGYTRTPGIFRVAYEQQRPERRTSYNMFNTSFSVTHKFENDIEMNAKIDMKLIDEFVESGASSTNNYENNYGIAQGKIYTVSYYTRLDVRNDFFNPTDGSLTDFSIGFSYGSGKAPAGELINNRYIRLISTWNRYQPFISRKTKTTLATRLKAGAIFEVWGSEGVPSVDLFYAGGTATVRGYEQNLLGPAASYDKNGHIEKAAGGKLLYLMNAELRIPLFWLFIAETFVDGGNVWREPKKFKPASIKFTTGIGLAMLTVIGPIRVDYGYKLLPEDTDPTPDYIHLGFYFAF
jgi:outer membrane protein insertion porin family